MEIKQSLTAQEVTLLLAVISGRSLRARTPQDVLLNWPCRGSAGRSWAVSGWGPQVLGEAGVFSKGSSMILVRVTITLIALGWLLRGSVPCPVPLMPSSNDYLCTLPFSPSFFSPSPLNPSVSDHEVQRFLFQIYFVRAQALSLIPQGSDVWRSKSLALMTQKVRLRNSETVPLLFCPHPSPDAKNSLEWCSDGFPLFVYLKIVSRRTVVFLSSSFSFSSFPSSL